MKRNKLLLLLALLMTAVTGAWADETPLVTIESKDYTSFTSGSQTFDDKVTVTFSNEVINSGDVNGWYATETASLLTVTGINGYTITSCKFYTAIGDGKTGYTVEGKSPSVYLYMGTVYTDANKSVYLGGIGINKIEVFGAAASSGYTVTLKDGVKDAAKWTITPNEGLKEGDEVTIQYSGRLKVKGVKATSDAAAPSVPDGALSGVFSVSDSKQVYFSKGNLRYASSKWSFFDNQYDYYTSYSADAWDKFGWSTAATTYGMSTSSSNSDYSGDFVDWGATMGTGWFTLSKDEWTYLLNTRSASTVGGTENGRYAKAMVNDVQGVILFPDSYTHPDGVTAPTGVNATDETGWDGNSYTAADWTKMESAGCVFLPAAGMRSGSSVYSPGTQGRYWSATPIAADYAYRVYFTSGNLNPAAADVRRLGLSVRLVQEVAAEAPAAGKTVDLSKLEGDYEAQNGDVLTRATSSYKVTIAAGATVTLDGATISSSDYCIKCDGDATIILKDGTTNTLTSSSGEYPALWIGDANTTLTIQGSTGVLNVASGPNCAGIGGGYMNANSTCGNISIEGGVITAQGGYGAAGIGSDSTPATCGDIIITGGTITAKGGSSAAGIGAGYGDGGNSAVCGAITIANTVTKVTATKGENASHSIGKGYGDNTSCGTVTIGGTVYWQNNAAVGDGATYLATSPLVYQPSN